MTDPLDHALATLFGCVREIEPTAAEVHRALDLDRARRTRRRRIVATGAAIALLGAGAYGVPVTRAAVDDVYAALAPWAAGHDDAAPGRALGAADDAPAWIRESSGQQRVIAENGSVKLFALREPGGELSVALGGSVGITDTIDGWRARFADHAVVVLGPGGFRTGPLDRQGRRPLFGLTATRVARVELRYASGPPTAQDGLTGGFVLLADATRAPRSLVAEDRTGHELERVSGGGIDVRVCPEGRGCPLGRFQPQAAHGAGG